MASATASIVITHETSVASTNSAPAGLWRSGKGITLRYGASSGEASNEEDSQGSLGHHP
jgi:hypothetical protein